MKRHYRMQVAMTPEVVEALDRLAAATGSTRSAVAAGILDDARPAVHMLAKTFERVRNDPNRMADAAMALTAAATEMADDLTQQARALADVAAQRRRLAGHAPPPSNTGG